MNSQEHPILAISGIIESMHSCEVCYLMRPDSELIDVNCIEYHKWGRVFPWYICKNCAKKISDALKEKEGSNG